MRLDFLAKQSGPGDVLVVFDGRSKQCRSWLNSKISGVEVWVLFDGKQKFRFRTRMVAFGSRSGEVGMIHFAFNRSKVPINERKQFSASSERRGCRF